ncbi:MAG: hypothetical protein WD270_04090 [Acetobacterales bacterium]
MPSDGTGRIGPHEGRELELMLAGRKPLAMFSDARQHRDLFPEDDFAPHVAAGRIIRGERSFLSHGGIDVVCIYYALPGEAWRIDAVHRIQQACPYRPAPAGARGRHRHRPPARLRRSGHRRLRRPCLGRPA